ncbi:phage protease [Cardiobacterium sp. AH-315-I02]|nr:phage protease [Cardiobacterium sp. AH-315-I02]
MYGHPSRKPAEKPNHAASIAVAACTFSLTATGEIQLTPAGNFSARDGRPYGIDAWVVTDETAKPVLAALAAHKDRIVIDYEHQTLYSDKNGQPAPAAGWFNGSDVVYRSGQGFFVTPEWTAAAKTHIEKGEYKYFSPVIKYNKKTGQLLDIVMGALTNYAAIDGMAEIEFLAAAKFDFSQGNPLNNNPANNQQENPMDEKLKTLLGLEKDASDEDVLAALKAVLTKAEASDNAIAAAKAETPSDTLDAMKVLQTQLAALKTQINDNEVADLVDVALSDGRLLADQEVWATNLGQSDLVSLKSYLAATQPIAALKGSQTNGKQPAGSETETLDDAALAVCKQMGIDPADYKKTLQETE